jgi:phosphoribosyl 1,2-cyclic phosphodiesterase
MIEICALASGSNGNSYYIGNNREAVLVDAGISTRMLIQRLKSRNLDIGKVKSVFLSHEHSDHSRGIQVLSKRHRLNIWMTSHTFYSLPHSYRPLYSRFFEPGETVEVGSFRIHTFLKNHDAVEPCSFRIESEGKSTGVFTDIGEPCDRVRTALNECHAVFIESNYDEKMLWGGSYPWPLKKRVASSVGHLSNVQALKLMLEESHPELECIFLSHLSQENNTPAIALSAFEPLHGKTKVMLTSRFEASEVYRIKM